MLRLVQEEAHDCFGTVVACITEIPRNYLPDTKPTILPDDLESVWAEWAKDSGYNITLSAVDPGGLCVANMHTEDEGYQEYNRKAGLSVATHAVVWDSGILWDPQYYNSGRLYGVHSFVKIERGC